MRKYFALIFIGLIGLFMVFASGPGNKVQDIKKVDLTTAAVSVQVDLNFGKFPLYFLTNKGQVHKKAKFYAKASRYTLWLTKEGFVFDSFKEATHPAPSGHPSQERHTPSALRGHPSQEGNNKYLRDVSRLVFLDANKNPGMVPIEKTKLRVNYFIGNDKSKWHCDIPTSAAVLYKELYKNIDLKVYGIEKQIEYDWIVKPGGNPKDIKFEYKNVKGTRLDEIGNLLIETDFGELIHKKPVGYQETRMAQSVGRRAQIACPQERKDVNVTFKKIAENTYGFSVGRYDKNCELIIDPVVLAYSTYLGGSDDESCKDIAIDNSGNAYVTGYTYSTDFPIMNQYQGTLKGFTDTFIAKIDTTQSGTSSLIYSTYLGGTNNESCRGIAVDNYGIAYITGGTSSTDFPILDQYQGTLQGYSDAIVAKIDTTQSGTSSLIYSTYLGGTSGDSGSGIAVDNYGNAYIIGSTNSTDFPILDQYQTFQGDRDVFVTKLDTTQSGTSSLIYSTYLGGDAEERSGGIALDTNGIAYITGTTDSSDFPILDQCWVSYESPDGFVTKIDTTQSGASSLLYSTCLGGGVSCGIAVDNSGNVYVTGYTYSSTFPVLNQYQTYQGDRDVFVTKLDTTQSGTSCLIYSTYLGGDSYDDSGGIAVDNNGNAYITGTTVSPDFPVLNQYQSFYLAADAFVTKIDTKKSGASSLIYSTFLGGDFDDFSYGIAVDGKGNTYVAGETLSADFPTQNQYQTDPYPGFDAFVTKLFYPDLSKVTTALVSSITATSAEGGGEVTFDGYGEVTARGVCWSTFPNPTTGDNHTTDGSGTGVFASSLTDLTPNTLYYVRAYATNAAGNAYGHEETFQTEKPSIQVTAPNGSESWEVYSSQTITWTSEWVVGNIKIEYSTNNGASWTEIIASTENDGSFPWTVPDAASNQCLMRVSESDGSPKDISDSVFSILTPGIIVAAPNGGEIWPVNSLQTINWSGIGTVGNVKIEYSSNNGDTWTVITPSTGNDGSFPWTVPDAVSNQCLIRVSETDGSPLDTSDSVFSIVASTSITVSYPNGGETFDMGAAENITWTSSGTVGNVKIEYSVNNGDTWTVITSSTGNDGSFPWALPQTVSDQCLVRVSEIDGSPSDTSNSVFSIRQKPLITVTSPNGQESWHVGSVHTITWTSEGDISNVLIEYSVNGGGSWRIIVKSTGNDGSFNWTVPNRPSDRCLVRISSDDRDQGISDTNDGVFSIVPAVTATVTVISPNGGEQLAVGFPYEIKWTATGTDQVLEVTIEYSTDRGTTWTTILPSIPNAPNGSFDWTPPNTPSENCRIRIRGLYGDDAPWDTSDKMFTIFTFPSPAIIVTSPNGGETWRMYEQYTVTWETIGSVNNVKIEISDYGGEFWIPIVDSTPNSGSFDFILPTLVPSDNCLVRVSDSDNNGNPADTNDRFFSIDFPSFIGLTDPNGYEIWQAGSSQNITWGSVGIEGDVMISYSTNAGYDWTEITGSAANNGCYNWTVPDTPSEDCVVKIKAIGIDSGEELVDMSDNCFTITAAQDPSLTVTYPNGNEFLLVGATHEIQWTSYGPVGNVNIDYSTNGGESWTGIIQAAENNGSHEWTIPNDPSENCLIRVSETDGSPLDISDTVFSIAAPSQGSLTLTSPNDGETWLSGSMYEIKWTGTGSINHVDIGYSTDNGTTWKEIVQNTTNDGSFQWNVPDTPSDDCLVRIKASDIDWDGEPADVSDEVFSIVSSTVTFRVTSPNGGESWEVGATQSITWNSSEDISKVMIEYSYDNGNTWDTIVSSVSNSGTYDWPVPDTVSEQCLVRIIANDDDLDPKPSDVSDAEFSIRPPQSPFIRVITPNGGEQLVIGSIYKITWFSTDSREEAKIGYSINGGESWTEIIGSTENDGDYDWAVPDEPSESCLIRISETDGQPLDISDAVFSIVQPLPGDLTVLTPNGGENLETGSEYNISWTCGGLNNVIIEYSVNNGVTWLYIEKVPADDGSYTWIIPGTPSDNCLIRISGADSDENPTDISDGVFTISDPSQAFIEVFTPNGGENLSVGTEYYIAWTSAGINNVIIEYSTDNGAEWIPIDTVSAIGGRFTWTVPGTLSDSCLVRISGDDSPEAPSDVSDSVFSITNVQ